MEGICVYKAYVIDHQYFGFLEGFTKSKDGRVKFRATQYDKDNYIVYCANALYLRMGMRIRKTNRGVKFTESYFVKDMVELCIQLLVLVLPMKRNMAFTVAIMVVMLKKFIYSIVEIYITDVYLSFQGEAMRISNIHD